VPKKKALKKRSRSQSAISYRKPAGRAVFSVPSSMSTGPTRLYQNFKYMEHGFTVNPGVSGTTGVSIFNLAGLFDPWTTGGGHQPAGYDQMMAIYEEYCVYAVKWRLTMGVSATNEQNICGVTVTDDPTSKADARVYVENGLTQWKHLGGSTQAGPFIGEFSGYVDIAKVHGLTRAELITENAHKGLVGSIPAESVYMHVWAASADATADTAALLCELEIEYFTILQGGKLNAIS